MGGVETRTLKASAFNDPSRCKRIRKGCLIAIIALKSRSSEYDHKYHNHKLQTNPQHREKEAQDSYKASERQ